MAGHVVNCPGRGGPEQHHPATTRAPAGWATAGRFAHWSMSESPNLGTQNRARISAPAAKSPQARPPGSVDRPARQGHKRSPRSARRAIDHQAVNAWAMTAKDPAAGCQCPQAAWPPTAPGRWVIGDSCPGAGPARSIWLRRCQPSPRSSCSPTPAGRHRDGRIRQQVPRGHFRPPPPEASAGDKFGSRLAHISTPRGMSSDAVGGADAVLGRAAATSGTGASPGSSNCPDPPRRQAWFGGIVRVRRRPAGHVRRDWPTH